jgi:hypothetical protein
MSTMTLEEALGTLIRMLNPYTDGARGSMTLGAPVEISAIAADGDTRVDVSQVQLEIDDYHDYHAEWTFKGQPQRIARGLRIQYRHRANGEAGRAGVCATEHLLIGFAGANGGG